MYAALALLALALPALGLADFENTAIVRSIDLGGSSVKSTTTFAVRALRNGVNEYAISLPAQEAGRTRWMEAKLKGSKSKLPLNAQLPVIHDGPAWTYTLTLPTPLAENGTVQIVLETVQTKATRAWPAEAGQTDPQVLRFESDLLVLSPYGTVVQRTKIKSPSPKVITYVEPGAGEAFTQDTPVTKSGATLTYGPFSNLPPSDGADFVKTHQRSVPVQYGYEFPVLEVTKFRRYAEVSHWGANLNIHDEMNLRNAGPTLKGHFSRLEHQTQKFHNRISPHIVPDLTLELPAGIRDAYYVDIVGNVSTSKLRIAPRGSPRKSIIELRPRYPVLGGWNYTFTLGYDAPLQDSARYDKASGKYILAVPIFTKIPNAVIDDAEVMVILPEGATDVEVNPPFPPMVMSRSTHVTYLDSIGRPAVTFAYDHLTEKHLGTIYVLYKVSAAAHFRKIGTVTGALMLVFVVAIGARRISFDLARSRAKKVM